jgi:hypothetical protein
VIVVVVGGTVTVVVVCGTVVVVVDVEGLVVEVDVVVGASVVEVVVSGGAAVVVVVDSGTVTVVVVVSAIVDVVVGGTVVVDVLVLVDVEVDVLVLVVDVLVVVVGPPLHGWCGGVVVVVLAGKRQPGCDVVVGPPVPTAVAEMPSVCGEACGIGHVTGASRPIVNDAVSVMPIMYDVTVALAFPAVIVTVTSGVFKTPGCVDGVLNVTMPDSFGVTVPKTVAATCEMPPALMRNVVPVGVAVTAALFLL